MMAKEILTAILITTLRLWGFAACLHLAMVALLMWGESRFKDSYSLFVCIGLVLALILPSLTSN